MQITTGVYGAKVQSWKKNNPREHLLYLVKKYGDDKDTIFEKMEEKLNSNQSMQDVANEYWITNNYRSVVDELSTPRARIAPKKERMKKVVEAAEKVKVAFAKIVILEMAMPNGKTLGESTGREVRKVGGLFAKIAAKVPPNKRVDAVLSEEEAMRLWRSA